MTICIGTTSITLTSTTQGPRPVSHTRTGMCTCRYATSIRTILTSTIGTDID